ncbi:uncharacterized protein LDX57_009103 [Aspergillus melleus]|uniref:uncharacterized protein n=1 Tax=Aspergillus melleus TaxID=138277 RepID=UPI001E8D135E|nr:uncharacterized protein LDX57_009103 [Aspergillus melleus]KAH8431441.1 hypothetical protein LDX57_009103 [Aspergillus melleus]
MSPARTNLLSLPVELLETITLYLEYAYEISSLAQTCRRLYDVANYHLFQSYAADCSLQGFERIVKSNNVDALRKLWDNGFQFGEYSDATDHSSPILLTADPDLPEMAELLVACTEAFLGDRRCLYDIELFEDDLATTLCRAARKGSLGVLEALTSSKAVKEALKISVLPSAVEEGQLASVRYLIEKGGVDVNTPFPGGILKRCAYQGNLEMVKFLVEAGADLDKPIFKHAINSPIHIAAASHHEEVVQYLIEMGMRLTCLKLSDLADFVDHYRYPNLPVTNIINGNDLRTMFPDVGDDPEIKYYFYHMIVLCNDLPLYQEVSAMWGSSAEWDHLPHCFELAVRQENLPLARYFLDEITKRQTWRDDWSKLCFSTFKSRGALFFDMLLDHGTPDPSDPDESWFRRLLDNARNYPEHIKVLLRRGYLGDIKAPHTLKEILIGAFKANDLAFVSRIIEHGELSLLNPLDSPRLYDHEQTALQIAAYSSSLETFRGFLSAHDLALDPSHPIHCSALVSAALGANVDVIGYFLGEGFDVNALYSLSAIRKNKPAEALIIHVAKAWFVEILQ